MGDYARSACESVGSRISLTHEERSLIGEWNTTSKGQTAQNTCRVCTRGIYAASRQFFNSPLRLQFCRGRVAGSSPVVPAIQYKTPNYVLKAVNRRARWRRMPRPAESTVAQWGSFAAILKYRSAYILCEVLAFLTELLDYGSNLRTYFSNLRKWKPGRPGRILPSCSGRWGRRNRRVAPELRKREPDRSRTRNL